MHEMSLVSALLDSLQEMKEAHDWKAVISVTLKVGAMRQVVPETMIFAFQVSVRGTSLDGATLVLIPVPVRFFCAACGARWGREKLGYLCPSCGGMDVVLEQGMELELDSVEVEE
ncbi:MAG: hydrogenase expression protein HypD [Dethiosulfovibrio peptidovorans]|nr:MAG: hydrogenase expression protein HypD [Dethiosulfovibrio peptidovorans]